MGLRKLVAGNWKMNGDMASLAEIDSIARALQMAASVDVAVCPPVTLIKDAANRQPGLAYGAQDCHWDGAGAHTGCLSVAMLREIGATLVIVGHSERRSDNHETSSEVKAKAEAAIAGGLCAIVCVGETEAERDAGNAIDVVSAQLDGSLPDSATPNWLVVAYEPVWAIGTGRTPTGEDVAAMHGAIRKKLVATYGDTGKSIRILYGGSVKPSNAAELMAIPDVDGALVGGASLRAQDFVPIIMAAI